LDVEILNALGQRVQFEHFDTYPGGLLPFTIDAPGVYTVKVRTKDGIRVVPIMINN